MDRGHIVRRIEKEASPQIIAFQRYVVDANELEQRSDHVAVGHLGGARQVVRLAGRAVPQDVVDRTGVACGSATC